VQRRCVVCDGQFEAKRASAKYCGARCRERAYRGSRSAAVTLAAPVADGPLVRSARRGLESAGRLDTELGTLTLMLAAKIDSPGFETGAGLAALMREFRATLAEAMANAGSADDPLEAIRTKAALKLVRSA
jgi:hypothetical protein